MAPSLRAYAGIGSRETPTEILTLMTELAQKLESLGWILRSGGAAGADSAFERGILDPNNKEIYLPSDWFNGRKANSLWYIDASRLKAFPKALKSVDQFHPAPQRLSDYARKLMARNCCQILGKDLQTPSSGVIAWTEGGRMKGGTSQALRIALF